MLQQSLRLLEFAEKALAVSRRNSKALAEPPSIERNARGVTDPPPTGPKTKGIGIRQRGGGMRQLA
jgi:hypothetical protein